MAKVASPERRGAEKRDAGTVLARAGALFAMLIAIMVWNGPLESASHAITTGFSKPAAVLAVAVRSAPTLAVTPEGTYRVGTRTLAIVEPVRAGSGPARALPTQVWYPYALRHAPPGPGRAPRSYPLIVFSQGYDLSVHAYAALLAGWASAGFVVAAPTYPHTDPSDPAALDESDILYHPADLRFVITTLLHSAGQRGSVLYGLVNGSEVGIAGHSDGAEVTLAVGDNLCCRDARVKAVAVFSGAELASFGGSYFSGPSVPLLVVQGNADLINPPVCSTQLYDAAPDPKYYVDLIGAKHEPPFAGPQLGPPADRRIVASATTDFFDAELAGESAAISAMRAAGTVAGVAQVTVDGSAPFEPGSCPGA